MRARNEKPFAHGIAFYPGSIQRISKPPKFVLEIYNAMQ